MVAILKYKKANIYTYDGLEIELPDEICGDGTEILGVTKDGKLREKKLYHKTLVIVPERAFKRLEKENEDNWRRSNPEGMGR